MGQAFYVLSILYNLYFLGFGVGVALEELGYELGTGSGVFGIAIIAVDEAEGMPCVEGEFCSLVVGCGSANASYFITIDRHSLDIESSSSDAFVGFVLTAYSQREDIALNLIAIKASDAVAIAYGGEINEVDEC